MGNIDVCDGSWRHNVLVAIIRWSNHPPTLSRQHQNVTNITVTFEKCFSFKMFHLLELDLQVSHFEFQKLPLK